MALGFAALLVVPCLAFASSASPQLVGAISNNTSLSGALATAVSGNDAYTTAYWTGQVTAVNFSSPSSPSIDGTTSTDALNLQNGTNIATAGNLAFVVSKNRNASISSNDDGSGNSMTVVDISNAASPTALGTIRDTGQLFGGYGVAVSGNYAFVAYQGVLCCGQPKTPDTSTGGFTVIDISTPSSPTIVANIDNGTLSGADLNALDHATSVAISGNYAYVTAFYSHRVTVIDISQPASPKIVDVVNDATNLPQPVDLAVQGHYLYVAQQIGGLNPELSIYDISTPANPVFMGSIANNTILAGAYRIRVRGDFAYLSGNSTSAIGAVDVSDPVHPRLAGYLQDAGHLYDTSGLDLDSTGRYVIANAPVANTDTGCNTTYPTFPACYTHGTISVIDMDPVAIGVTIAPASEPPSLTAQTSASFSFSTTDQVAAVACSLDGAPYGLCTSATTQNYSSLSVGSHTFTVQATDAAGKTATDTYTWTVGAIPRNTSAPTVSGNPTPGQTLTGTTGTWTGSPAPTYSYQWEDCDSSGNNCNPVASGGTGLTYVVAPSDLNSTIELQVTATNSLGQTQANSAPTSAATYTPVDNTPPAISGTATQGQTLTESNGSWSNNPTSYSHQWEHCNSSGASCSAIQGATAPTYQLTSTDVGGTVVVEEWATNNAGTSPSPATSAPTAIVTGPPVNTAPPSISGNATQGQTLTTSNGAWGGYPAPSSFTYQWYDCLGNSCTSVANGGASTYTLQAGDVGHTIEVAVTAHNGVGSTASPKSAPTGVVAGGPSRPANTSPPAISGAAVEGQALTASAGSWSGNPAPSSYSYSWQRCNPFGQSCAAIAGASGSSYRTTPADVGATLRVAVTATNTLGNGSATSTQTGPVSPNVASIKSMLAAILGPGTARSRISQILAARGYQFLGFVSPGPGKLVLSWYYVPPRKKGRHKPKPVLVAIVTVNLTSAGRHPLVLKLTRAGKKLLRGAGPTIKLTTQVVFTAPQVAPVSESHRFTLKR